MSPRRLLALLRFEKVGKDVAATLDLREEPSECKRPAIKKILSGIFKAPVWVRADVHSIAASAASSLPWRQACTKGAVVNYYSLFKVALLWSAVASGPG